MAKNPEAKVTIKLFNDDFNKSVKEMKEESSQLRKEFVLQEQQMKLTATETEKLGSKVDYLTQQHALATRKVAETEAQYEKVKTQFGENSVAAKKMSDAVLEAQIAQQKLSNELTQTEGALSKANMSEQQLASSIDKTTNNLKEQNRKLKETADTLEEVGNKAKSVGEKMKGAGQNLSVGVTLPIVGIGIASAKTAIEFEAQMDKVGAVAGATAIEMEALSQTALDLGANTSKSASEVAAGMGELAAMGFTVTEIIGAMPGVISAAEASGSDMAQTAEVMASTLNIFGLEATKANDVADILAKTANISAANLTDMQYALKYAGPPAAALGISLEELSAAIGIMTNAGMKGEQAGTTLRGALLGLLDPSEENSKRMEAMGVTITDAQGNFVGLSNLIQNLSDSMKGQTETQKAATISALVGKEAVSGMLSLMAAGPSTIDKLTASLQESGGASEFTAAKMRDNLKGALDELGGTIETAAITIGTILKPAILAVAEIIQSLVDEFQNLSPIMQTIIIIFGAIAATIGPLLILFGLFASAIGSIMTFLAPLILAITEAGGVIAFLSTQLGFLTPLFTALTGPIGLTIAAIAGIIAIIVLAYNKVDWFREGVNNIFNSIKEATTVSFGAIKQTINSIIGSVVSYVKSQLDVFKKFWDENGKQITAIVILSFGIIKSNIELVMGIIKGIFQIVWPLIAATVRYAWETIKLAVSTAINLVLGIIQTVLKILQGDWKGAWDTILQTVKDIWSDVGTFLEGIDLKQTGKDIIQGLINGIGSMSDAVWKKVSGIVDGIKSAITGALKIKSPSRVTMEYGVNIGQGLINGIQEMNAAVKNSAYQMAQMAIPSQTKNEAIASANNSIASNSIGNVYITIPAKDIKEFNDVTDFFKRLPQKVNAY